ncbi:uncharacterized protein [Petaurus breviceps papuanus]|uniref:uncharacterized protein isoform X2 n=1 Tax=Petaurus breviceps papuanus TaxID=3040969 RepID=UPI0036D94A74
MKGSSVSGPLPAGGRRPIKCPPTCLRLARSSVSAQPHFTPLTPISSWPRPLSPTFPFVLGGGLPDQAAGVLRHAAAGGAAGKRLGLRQKSCDMIELVR